MFDESKHPRADDGKFTDGKGGTKSEKLKEAERVYNSESEKTYPQNTSYSEILTEDNKRKNLSEQNVEEEGTENYSYEIDSLLGEEFKDVKGQDAVDKLMQEKRGHVKGAFHREDVGDIDLLWGNDYLGLQHIIKQREKQGINIQDFVNDLAEVIENGNFRKKNDRGNFEFIYNGKVAVISPELRNNKMTFLLTAFKTHSKK